MIQFTPFFRSDTSLNKVENKPYSSSSFRLGNRFTCDEVSFKKTFIITDFPQLPCAYTREIMLTTREQKEFGALIPSLKGKNLQEKLLKTFQNRWDYLEKNIALFLAKKAQVYPEKNIQEILQILAVGAEKKISNIQLKILQRAEIYTIKNMPLGNSRENVLENLKKAQEAIFLKKEKNIFKRKKVLGSIIEIEQNEKNAINKVHLKKIIEIVDKLPNSLKSKWAFIVKYQRRESREIGERLLNPYISTKDHIICKSDKKNTSSDPWNFLAVSGHINWLRGSMPFDKFVAKNPWVIPNITYQLKVIKEFIEKNKIESLRTYIPDVSQNLYIQSKGMIDLPYREFSTVFIKKPVQSKSKTPEPYSAIIRNIIRIARAKLPTGQADLVLRDLISIKKAIKGDYNLEKKEMHTHFIKLPEGEIKNYPQLLTQMSNKLSKLPDLNPKDIVPEQKSDLSLKTKPAREYCEQPSNIQAIPTLMFQIKKEIVSPFDRAIKLLRRHFREREHKENLLENLQTAKTFLEQDENSINPENFFNMLNSFLKKVKTQGSYNALKRSMKILREYFEEKEAA